MTFSINKKRIQSIILIIVAFFLVQFPKPIYGQFNYNDLIFQLNLESRFVEVVLVNDGEIKTLYGKNAESQMYPASITKVLTTIVAIEHLADQLDEVITIQPSDTAGLATANASVAGFVVGENVQIKELLYGALLPSGADATNALARIVSGTNEEFIQLINRKAQVIGLKKSNFVNVTGLYHNDHYTTAHDLNLLMAYALNNDTFKEIASTMRFRTEPNNKRSQGMNLNHTIYSTAVNNKIEVEYIDGGKTGWIPQSGYNLTSFHDFYDKTIIITTGDAYTPGSNLRDHETIYKALMETIHEVVVVEANENLGLVPINYVWGIDNVKLSLNEPLKANVPILLDKKDLTAEVIHEEKLEAPLEAEVEIGQVNVYFENQKLVSSPISTSTAYERSNILYVMVFITSYFSEHWQIFVSLVVILLLLIIGGAIYSYIRRRRRRRGKRQWKL